MIAALAGRYCLVARQCREAALELGQPAQPLGANCMVGGDESATSSQRSQRFGVVGTSLAAGRPETVISIASPLWTRRTSSDASWRSSRSPTVSIWEMSQRCYRLLPPPRCGECSCCPYICRTVWI